MNVLDNMNQYILDMGNIRNRGTIAQGETDYPIFSDEQLDRMTVISNVLTRYSVETLVRTVRGHRIPYINDMEYVRIDDVCTVIRWKDTLAVIVEDGEE